jgi:hypothetical protein
MKRNHIQVLQSFIFSNNIIYYYCDHRHPSNYATGWELRIPFCLLDILKDAHLFLSLIS